MKRRQMNSTARALCEHLMSRNNDIGGYWGVGKLCEFAVRERRAGFSLKIYPGQPIRVFGSELGGSSEVTTALLQFELDSIEGRMTFTRDGFFPSGAVRYICTIAIAITQDRRTGMYLDHVRCWPHDYSKESRSGRLLYDFRPPTSDSIVKQLNNLNKGAK